jgi:hypothetical protein
VSLDEIKLEISLMFFEFQLVFWPYFQQRNSTRAWTQKRAPQANLLIRVWATDDVSILVELMKLFLSGICQFSGFKMHGAK